ncbi:hypothetical protein [Janthinobacterium sp. SUN137]|uniref:hypothetical protein n=1 Tax=Janthinobacterium sp. SUN137 TaxID=3014789 RepID=UPI002712B620|nr:hypothetical protein [Janthinobacterium sp. SUN137]MDO8038387.1 hypothetical protein [Janthinobacterium sp. SUN137]
MSSSKTLFDRFQALISAKTHEARRFKELEEVSGIAAVSWRKAFTKGQRPTAEMIESVSKVWPEHAFWLVTGTPDPVAGHVGIATNKDETLDYLGLWEDKASPYSSRFFREVISTREVIDQRRNDKGDGGISSAERIALIGTEEMRFKEIEHYISSFRQARNTERYPESEENYLDDLPDFRHKAGKTDGDQKK